MPYSLTRCSANNFQGGFLKLCHLQIPGVKRRSVVSESDPFSSKISPPRNRACGGKLVYSWMPSVTRQGGTGSEVRPCFSFGCIYFFSLQLYFRFWSCCFLSIYMLGALNLHKFGLCLSPPCLSRLSTPHIVSSNHQSWGNTIGLIHVYNYCHAIWFQEIHALTASIVPMSPFSSVAFYLFSARVVIIQW